MSQTGERRQKSSQARLARFARVRLFATYSLPMSLLILKFHSHDHQTDNLLRESRHDNSKPIIIASSATTTLSNIYSSHGQLYPTFILHSSYIIFTDHTTFHSHDHRTDNLLKESRHDNSRQITIASQVIISLS